MDSWSLALPPRIVAVDKAVRRDGFRSLSLSIRRRPGSNKTDCRRAEAWVSRRICGRQREAESQKTILMEWSEA